MNKYRFQFAIHKWLKHSFCLMISMFCIVQQNYATHIVGGQMTYECLGISGGNMNIRVSMILYRDEFSGGAPFDDDANFGIYSFDTDRNTWQYVSNVPDLDVIEKSVVGYDTTDPCVEIPPGVGVEQGVYEFELTLPIQNSDYMISYQRCCRNNTISNLVDSGSTGSALTVVISPTSQQSCNSSPVFQNYPPIFVCQNKTLEINQNATDADGDVLVYRFCAPFTAGGDDMGNAEIETSCTGVKPNPVNCRPPYEQVTFAAPFTPTNPMGGSPTIQIDSNTGLITGVPTQIGQYAVGICVEEYRNGVKIGEVIRDFQFNVVRCDPLVEAILDIDSLEAPKSYVVKLCGENSYDFTNASQREDKIVSYRWEFDVDNQIYDFDTRDVSYTFPDTGTYYVNMFINEGYDCADTANVRVEVYPPTISDFSFDYDTCVSGPVDFTNLSSTESVGISEYDWIFASEGTSTEENPNFLFVDPGSKVVTLSVTDVNGCEVKSDKVIDYYPAPSKLVTVPTLYRGCNPSSITFENLSVPIDTTYQFTWDFGDGSVSNELSPQHLYDQSGVFTVTLKVVSPLGCEIERTFNNLITIKDSPTADFSYSPSELNFLENQLYLTNQSINEDRVQWIIEDVGVSQLHNPTFELPDTGKYEVTLVAFHESGCPDTLTQMVDVKPLDGLYFPNAFSPNNDGKNEVFIPVGLAQGISDYEFSVWNRWGEQIFTTDNVNEGWDGYIKNGNAAPDGAYVYSFKYLTGRQQLKSGEGKVILVR